MGSSVGMTGRGNSKVVRNLCFLILGTGSEGGGKERFSCLENKGCAESFTRSLPTLNHSDTSTVILLTSALRN